MMKFNIVFVFYIQGEVEQIAMMKLTLCLCLYRARWNR